MPGRPRRSSRFGWARLALGLLLLTGTAAAVLAWTRDGSAPPQAKASAGRGYYVYVAEIEVEGTNEDGSGWDPGGGAPDLAYEIRWRGVTVFRSTTVPDALVARWSLAGVGLDNLAGGVSKESTLRAARIHPADGESIEIAVVDSDVAFDDPVATWSVPVASLNVGTTEVTRPAGRVRRAVLVARPFEDVTAGDLLR